MKRILTTISALTLAFTLLFIGGLVFVQTAVQPVQAQGGVTGFANIRITNFYRTAPRTAITVTTNGSLNPTGTNQRIQAAFGGAAFSGDDITVEPAGSILILTNVSTNTIVITETGTLISSGNITLGENDNVILLSDGTYWREISETNN